MNVNVRGVVPVLASALRGDINDEIKTVSSFGLTELIGLTLQVVPESARMHLINAQSVDLDLKGKRATKWLAGFRRSNFATQASPLFT